MSILTAILVLSFLIIIHEIGHYAAAKLLGVKVVEFSLFMGPRLLSFQRGETRYSLKLIPVGGSCLMEGEQSSSADNKALNQKPRWVRAVIFLAGSFMNLATAYILILIISFYNGSPSNVITSVSNYITYEQGYERLAPGDDIISYAGRRVRVPSEIYLYLQDTKGAPAEIRFKRDGETRRTVIRPDYTPAKRYILGFTGAESFGPDWNLAAEVSPGDPAELMGLRPGDRIITVAGRTPQDRAELRAILEENDGGEVTVTWIKADGTPGEGRLTPKLVEGQEQYVLGVYFDSVKNPGLLYAVRYAFFDSISYSKMIIYSVKWMVTGAIGLNHVSGPVGIVAEIGAVVDETSKSPDGPGLMISYLMHLSALIGINLGLFNLIPFPPLDGSKLLLLGIEAVRRKDISYERQMAISMVGFVVFVIIMLLTLFNDITRIVAK